MRSWAFAVGARLHGHDGPRAQRRTQGDGQGDRRLHRRSAQVLRLRRKRLPEPVFRGPGAAVAVHALKLSWVIVSRSVTTPVEGAPAMRISRTVVTAVAVASVVAGVSVASCSSKPKSPTATSKSATSSAPSPSSTPSSTSAKPVDYTGLLIQASDINAPEAFTASPPVNNPNGQAGVTTTFSNPDRTH